MIVIDLTPTALIVRRDDLPEPIQIARCAVAQALPSVLAALLDTGTALSAARRMAYDDGLVAGRLAAEREYAITEAKLAMEAGYVLAVAQLAA